MKTENDPSAFPSEQPFPLKRYFRRGVLPGMAAFIAAVVALTTVSARHLMEAIYLDLAQGRAEGIAHGVAEAQPQPWADLLANRSDGPTLAAVAEAFNHEIREFRIKDIKVYDRNRRVIFATDSAKIGTLEKGAALQRVIENGDSVIVPVVLPDNTHLYELYVPLVDGDGRLEAVFELYEPIDYLDAILLRLAVPTVAVPGILLLVLIAGLAHLVSRAQADIDHRTSALNALRKRLETFVSTGTIDAARSAGDKGAFESIKVTCSLLFSDVRDFTGFSEANSPEQVVNFLNDIMAVQVKVIQNHGGDVDKMIGDAVLARFDGPEKEANAIAAATEILRDVNQGSYPRGIGIGVFTGEVISGAVGPADRRDFTVIGDSVNIAARLCSAARQGELVADADSVGASETSGFDPAETISVKGRQEPLSVHRWSI